MISLLPGKPPKKISTACLPKDMHYADIQKWYVYQIAIMYGVPAKFWR